MQGSHTAASQKTPSVSDISFVVKKSSPGPDFRHDSTIRVIPVVMKNLYTHSHLTEAFHDDWNIDRCREANVYSLSREYMDTYTGTAGPRPGECLLLNHRQWQPHNSDVNAPIVKHDNIYSVWRGFRNLSTWSPREIACSVKLMVSTAVMDDSSDGVISGEV